MEIKISLSLLVQGAGLLTPGFCEKNSKESYNEHKVLVTSTKGKGKHQKTVKQLLTVHTRKHKLITHNINLCNEAYEYMLECPTSAKLQKTWKSMSKKDRLKHHFDLIAHDLGAVSYSYEVFND